MDDIKFPPLDKEAKRRRVLRRISRFLVFFAVASILVALLTSYLPRLRSNSGPKLPGSSAVENGWSALRNLKDSSWGAFQALRELDSVLTNLPREMLLGDGEGALTALRTARDRAADLENALSGPGAGIWRPLFPGAAEGIREGRQLLSAFISWADIPRPRQVVILFSNTSELRPGGGFTGSFAVAEIYKGSLRDLKFHDINESDRLLDEKIIPPAPLQAITARFRAADANWFFDFPVSAEKSLDFMERSKFTPAGANYDALISVSPRVISDILAVTGPITLAGGKTIDKDNFLPAIQEEVQSGQASGNEAPKAILGELLPALRDKAASMDSGAATTLLGDFRSWTARKDIMIYARDPALAAVLKDLGADGSIYPLSGGMKGDYLAAVNANIGGGKSDFVVTDAVDFESDIASSGIISDRLNVTRTHGGDRREEWWYKATDWDYLRIFVADGSVPEKFEGGGVRMISPKADYSRGFITDPDVAAIEKTLHQTGGFKGLDIFKESGREVFATWLKIPAGEKRTIHAEWSRTADPLTPGDEYTFVFEGQQGEQGSFHAILRAPQGMVWAESGAQTYEINSDLPVGRLVSKLKIAPAPDAK